MIYWNVVNKNYYWTNHTLPTGQIDDYEVNQQEVVDEKNSNVTCIVAAMKSAFKHSHTLPTTNF